MRDTTRRFDGVALHTVEQWRFWPALLTSGTSVAQRVHVSVHFTPRPPTDEEMDAIMDAAVTHGARIVVISR